MIRSHHIATALVAEHQRELRASARRGWRLSQLFSRHTPDPEPVPPAPPAGGAGPGLLAARVPAPASPLRARRIAARRRTYGRERVGV